ncbi:MAG: N-acetyl-gamma-glutamyl-phosphate reductase [Solobacterium sp.]|nr:N-acetyl-gamma-glutamyl-phosphate reductase [Solobacterium sp.]
MIRVFIDGSSGTTGLKIKERLKQRSDIELLEIPYELRHEIPVRKEIAESADCVFLCLPDDAAKEIASFIDPKGPIVIDTSTAHRTSDAWVYGMAEIEGQREKIAKAKRIANPGCHASGFIALVSPLVKHGILKEGVHLECLSLTGYSGGGKKMIAQYEEEGRDPLLCAPRMYGLSQNHKHLPEMMKMCALRNAPVFLPVVADFYSGMETVVPLFPDMLEAPLSKIEECYEEVYSRGLVRYVRDSSEGGFLSAGAYALRDDMEVSVFGNEERILLTARFDNLGKGASGAAIQNMNIALGLAEDTGLITGGKQV